MKHLTDRGTVREMAKFSLPIMAGSFLQQFYTVVDSLIVGRSIGKNGLAAIGVSGSLISFLIFIVFGIGIGMTVLLSKYSGEQHAEKYRKIAQTALTGGLLIAAGISVLCLILAQPILTAFRTQPEIMGDSLTYLRIMAVGLVFSFLYNYYNALLLSQGDSRTPFAALAASTVINVGLTALLVTVWHTGVAGAAIGSVGAQFIAFLICYLHVRKRYPQLNFSPRQLRIDRACLRETFEYSGTAALQKLLFFGGRLLIQSAVNVLPIGVIAGYTVAGQIEGFVFAAIDGPCTAISRYGARYTGTGEKERAVKAFFAGLTVSLALGLALGVGIYLAAPLLISAFAQEGVAEEMQSGVTYLRTMCWSYLLVGVSDSLLALLRGLGRLRRTVVATVMQMSFRVSITYLLLYRVGITAICFGTISGWIAITLFNGYFAWHWAELSRRTQEWATSGAPPLKPRQRD